MGIYSSLNITQSEARRVYTQYVIRPDEVDIDVIEQFLDKVLEPHTYTACIFSDVSGERVSTSTIESYVREYMDANPIKPAVAATQCDTFKAMLDSAGVRYESFTGGASDDPDKDRKNVIRLTTPSAVTLYYFDSLGRLERVE